MIRIHLPLSLLAGLGVFLAAGCAPVEVTPTPTPELQRAVESARSGEPAPAVASVKLPTEMHWARDSAEKRAAYLQAYTQAKQRIDVLAKGKASGKWGVALDIDETVLDNSQYQVERFRAGSHHSEAIWDAWCERREAIPLPGASDFLNYVRSRGGKIALVSNRGAATKKATEDNLRAVGLVYDVYLPKTTESDKTPRFKSVEAGTADSSLGPVELLLYVGDNIQDFPNTRQSAIVDAPDSAYSKFGDTWIVLPNPMYGSWERNKYR